MDRGGPEMAGEGCEGWVLCGLPGGVDMKGAALVALGLLGVLGAGLAVMALGVTSEETGKLRDLVELVNCKSLY